MAYYTREQWGSAYERGGHEIGPTNEFYVHHFGGGITPPLTTADAMSRVRSAQRSHVNNGWSDLGYSFLVDDFGNVYEGRGWGRSGAHTYGYNSRGHACAWIGDSTIQLPSSRAIAAIAGVAREGIKLGWLSPQPTTVAHRDRVPDTVCCGDPMYAYLPQIRQIIGTPGPATELDTPTNPTAIPRWNEDYDMHICLYKPQPNVSRYLLVFGDGTFRMINPSDDTPWELINSRMVQLVKAGLVPAHADGSPVIGEVHDDSLSLLREVA